MRTFEIHLKNQTHDLTKIIPPALLNISPWNTNFKTLKFIKNEKISYNIFCYSDTVASIFSHSVILSNNIKQVAYVVHLGGFYVIFFNRKSVL